MSSSDSGNVIDYGDFPARLASQKDRWSLLKEVLDEWNIVIHREQEPECSPAAIAAAEARLGFALPQALKEWYALPFRFHESWPKGGTRLVPPTSEVEFNQLITSNGFVSFHQEGQTCCEWGFRVEDAASPDPPVYNGMDPDLDQVADSTHLTWIFQNQTLSEWVLQQTLSDVLWPDHPCAHAIAANEEEATLLLRGFRPMGLPTQPWYQVRLFGGPNAIMVVGPEDCDIAWERVKAAVPHPVELPCAIWDYLWEPATEGPLYLMLYCRDQKTLDGIVSTGASQWELRKA